MRSRWTRLMVRLMVRDQAKIHAKDKELARKEMERKPITSDKVDSTPLNRDAKLLRLPAFVDVKDELHSYVIRFKIMSRMPVGKKTHGILNRVYYYREEPWMYTPRSPKKIQ